MNEHAKEIVEQLTTAISDIPHQQISPEVMKLIIASCFALTLITIKFDK